MVSDLSKEKVAEMSFHLLLIEIAEIIHCIWLNETWWISQIQGDQQTAFEKFASRRSDRAHVPMEYGTRSWSWVVKFWSYSMQELKGACIAILPIIPQQQCYEVGWAKGDCPKILQWSSMAPGGQGLGFPSSNPQPNYYITLAFNELLRGYLSSLLSLRLIFREKI